MVQNERGVGAEKIVLESKAWITPENPLLDRRRPAASGLPALAPPLAGNLPPNLPSRGETHLCSKPRWPAVRTAAIEALWGPGFTLPGGAQETLRLAKPMGLSPGLDLMLIGGGLGGPAEAINTGLGATVSSFEADTELRQLATARQAQNGACQHIGIAGWDRTQPSFEPRSANHALSLEALRGHRLTPLLESLATALRPRGHIVLTELVSEQGFSESDQEFTAWCRLDGRLPNVPLMQEVTEGLQRLHFEVRVVEDLSDRHISQTLGGWRDAVRAMAAGPRPGTGTAACFVSEAELWLLRIRLMRRLGMRLMRWHAIGP